MYLTSTGGQGGVPLLSWTPDRLVRLPITRNPHSEPLHPAVFREEHVRLPFARGRRTSKIAVDLGFSYESLRKRIKQHRVGGVTALGVTSSERGTLSAHARQNPRLDTALTI